MHAYIEVVLKLVRKAVDESQAVVCCPVPTCIMLRSQCRRLVSDCTVHTAGHREVPPMGAYTISRREWGPTLEGMSTLPWFVKPSEGGGRSGRIDQARVLAPTRSRSSGCSDCLEAATERWSDGLSRCHLARVALGCVFSRREQSCEWFNPHKGAMLVPEATNPWGRKRKPDERCRPNGRQNGSQSSPVTRRTSTNLQQCTSLQ
jgi:hypothetical protein